LNKELQEKLSAVRSQVGQLEKQVFSLKKDNTELYEKLRYTQSYQREVMILKN
jgi:peptidoglycan hydrolase CwlO-like protein